MLFSEQELIFEMISRSGTSIFFFYQVVKHILQTNNDK